MSEGVIKRLNAIAQDGNVPLQIRATAEPLKGRIRDPYGRAAGESAKPVLAFFNCWSEHRFWSLAKITEHVSNASRLTVAKQSCGKLFAANKMFFTQKLFKTKYWKVWFRFKAWVELRFQII